MKMKRFSLLLLSLAMAVNMMSADRFSQLPKPILGGELSNSAATSVADIDEVLPRMKALGLNTVLVPAYWELTEPVEGQFDFTLIDRTIDVASREQLHVVFLWFGAWKNSMSCYAPGWFKQDTRRFPRAMTAEGKQLEIASCFSDNVLQADLKAFSALMRHIREKDPQRNVVIMMQIENEIGMLESARDHSPLAEKAYKKERWAERYGTDEYADEKFMALSYARYVEHLAKAARKIHDMPLYVNAAMNSRGRRPGEYPSAGPLAHLVDFWHKGAPSIDLLAPDIYDTGFKSWAAQYAMPQRPQDIQPGSSAQRQGSGDAHRQDNRDGQRNGNGDEQRNGNGVQDGQLKGNAPSTAGGKVKNRLFIPESRCCENSGVRALYVFGEHQALGFSPFAIDQAGDQETQSVVKAYDLMRQVYSLPDLREGKMVRSWGLLFDQEDHERVIDDDGVMMTCRHYFTLPWDPRATDGSLWPEGGAMIVRLGQYDYLLAGSGVVVDFKTMTEKQQERMRALQGMKQEQLGEDGFAEGGGDAQPAAESRNVRFKGHRLGLLSVDEVTIDSHGSLQYLRRHNGDQTHQGRHARISVGEWKVLHIKLYEY